MVQNWDSEEDTLMTSAGTFSRWFRPAFPVCLICGRDAGSPQRGNRVSPPVRHPEAQAILLRLCRFCSEAIPWIVAPVCRICGRPEACPDCPRRLQRHVVFSRSGVRYDDKMSELLARYKYNGSEKLTPLMSAMLACAYERIARELGGNGPHAITSVPLARERLEERGFNQAEQMARTVAAWYGILYAPLLKRDRHTQRQSLKNRSSRLRDLRGIFTLADRECLQAIQSRHPQPLRILLADDIYTTGSTMHESASALRNTNQIEELEAAQPPCGPLSPGPSIYGLTWARS